MGNPNSSRSAEFQSLLYYKFTFKKEYNKDKLAVFLNKAPDTVQRYVSGRLPVTADTARRIIKFVLKHNPKDTELLQFFCPPEFMPIPSAQAKLSKKARERKEIDLTINMGRAIEEIEKAYEDSKIEKPEYKEITKHLTRIRQLAAELDKKIQKEIK